MSSMEDKWRLVAITAVAPVAWGATYVVTRHLLPADAPLWGAALRALPAGLLLWALARRRPRGDWWWKAPVLGLLNFGAFFVLVYIAAQLLPSSIAASIMALAPLALAGLAWPLLSQRPTARWAVGALLGLVGVLSVVGLGTGTIPVAGVVASVIALLASSLGAILTTRWRDETPLLATTSWQLTAGVSPWSRWRRWSRADHPEWMPRACWPTSASRSSRRHWRSCAGSPDCVTCPRAPWGSSDC